MYIYIHVYTYLRVHTYIYVHVYIHVYICTHRGIMTYSPSISNPPAPPPPLRSCIRFSPPPLPPPPPPFAFEPDPLTTAALPVRTEHNPLFVLAVLCCSWCCSWESSAVRGRVHCVREGVFGRVRAKAIWSGPLARWLVCPTPRALAPPPFREKDELAGVQGVGCRQPGVCVNV